jgi:hypothetical protein
MACQPVYLLCRKTQLQLLLRVHFSVLGITLKVLRITLTQDAPTFDAGDPLSNLWVFVALFTVTLGVPIPVARLTLHLIEGPGIALGRRLNRSIASGS